MSIILSNSRYEEIKRTIVELFIKYDVNCVPVNGFELATKMGIKIIPYSAILINKRWLLFKKSEDGFCLEKSNDDWYIYYDDGKDYGRINNTIMHEIGHVALDHAEDSALAEKEVRFFAKYALAPPILIHKLQLQNATEISNFFNISYEAAQYAVLYYEKWLKFGANFYTDYERKLLKLFQDIA